jgi:hypothetical protein
MKSVSARVVWLLAAAASLSATTATAQGIPGAIPDPSSYAGSMELQRREAESAAQQQQQNAQMKMQQENALMGGLFGLGSAGIYGATSGGLKFSDRRLKKDIKKIGKTNDGQNLYSYRYKGDDTPQIGLMAQEVEKKKPDAVVTTPSGYKAVDYDKALGLMGAA